MNSLETIWEFSLGHWCLLLRYDPDKSFSPLSFSWRFVTEGMKIWLGGRYLLDAYDSRKV
jgi:hypothetical protein